MHSARSFKVVSSRFSQEGLSRRLQSLPRRPQCLPAGLPRRSQAFGKSSKAPLVSRKVPQGASGLLEGPPRRAHARSKAASAKAPPLRFKLAEVSTKALPPRVTLHMQRSWKAVPSPFHAACAKALPLRLKPSEVSTKALPLRVTLRTQWPLKVFPAHIRSFFPAVLSSCV